MLSQHFLNTLNGRYVIDYQMDINLDFKAFEFDITDKSNLLVKLDLTILQYILSSKLDDFIWYNIALSILFYWSRRLHNGIVAIIQTFHLSHVYFIV